MAKTEVEVVIKGTDKASPTMKKIGKSAKGMGDKFKKVSMVMAGMGIAMVATLGKMVNSYSKAGDEVQKMAKRTGFSTEALSELRHVAELTGTQLGSIEKATKRMSKAIIDASDGMQEYTEAFDKLGINVEELRELKPEEQFWAITDALAAVEDETLKVALAQEVFGRAGTDLLPMMAETTEALAGMKQEAHDLGIVFDQAAADAAAAFEDAKTKLKTAFQGISNSIASTIMPKLTEFISVLVEKMKPAIAWLQENPQVIEAFIKFGAILGVGGGVYLAVTQFVKVLGTLSLLVNSLYLKLLLIVSALLYVGLGFSAIAKGRWPTFKNIMLEAKNLGKQLGKLGLALLGGGEENGGEGKTTIRGGKRPPSP